MRTYASVITAAILSAVASAAPAQDAQTRSTALRIELNAAAPVDNACRLTFVATNGLEQDIGKAAFEFAIFNSDGLVERLSVLDFQDLPSGRTKVRQFDLANIACENVSRILVNDAKSCEGAEPTACLDQLEATTKAEIEFGT
ncbi:hypothetical protein [Nitratireductor basaltis]|uniref:Tat pathway signal sequence domain protein n=1 Tax=Nitratireductor basaltis TaxID=472175 RepID=A0A084UA33_9HYPH|nr:hypothetical protein [Nitratireductor basaltis]KFB09819.1 hypothetical protein EL18_00838 [Nitratireductor basaltis]